MLRPSNQLGREQRRNVLPSHDRSGAAGAHDRRQAAWRLRLPASNSLGGIFRRRVRHVWCRGARMPPTETGWLLHTDDARVQPGPYLPPRSPVVPIDARSAEASRGEPALEARDHAQARDVGGAAVSNARSKRTTASPSISCSRCCKCSTVRWTWSFGRRRPDATRLKAAARRLRARQSWSAWQSLTASHCCCLAHKRNAVCNQSRRS